MSASNKIWALGESVIATQLNGQFEGKKITGVAKVAITTTAPVPCYIDIATGQWNPCLANDILKGLFKGFAITTAALAGDSIDIQLSGIVSGFTGLTAGLDYYVSDTGAITATPGTYDIYVGIAVSTTEILIEIRKRRASGTVTISATGITTINTGFKVGKVKIDAVIATDGALAFKSNGGYTKKNGNTCIAWARGVVSGSTILGTIVSGKALYIFQEYGQYPVYTSALIDTITNGSFNINATQAGNTPGVVILYWEAEEL